uniref:enamelin n=1 Tax=Doryrhamphus excisus TaxID=161450 RepID=UPI0025AE34CE|nr:enamelin [Doryrhamphus excisus]
MAHVVLMMCLLVACSAAPAQESQNNEQIAAHANEALRWMEMYRLYQQQGMVANPFLPAAEAPAEPAAAVVTVDAAPAQPATGAPPPPPPPPPQAPAQSAGEASEEENDEAESAPKLAAPLNSDEEAEEAEEAEEEESAAEAAANASVPVAAVDVPAEVVEASPNGGDVATLNAAPPGSEVGDVAGGHAAAPEADAPVAGSEPSVPK